MAGEISGGGSPYIVPPAQISSDRKTVSGRGARGGSTFNIYDNGAQLSQVTADATGKWSVTLANALTAGHVVTHDALPPYPATLVAADPPPVADALADLFGSVSQSNLQALGTSAAQNQGNQYLPAGYTGPDPLFQIWVHDKGQFQTYQPFVNSEGVTGSTCWGWEWAFFLLWKTDNPGRTFWFWKHAIGNTGFFQNAGVQDWNINSTGELYAGATARYNAARAALVAMGKTVTHKWVACRIGEEDAKTSASSAAYKTNYQDFIRQSRIDWNYTRHAMSRLHLEQLNQGVPFWNAVRDAQKAIADADRDVEIIITDGSEFVDQTIHINRFGIDKMGRDFYWVYGRKWEAFPYTGLTQIAEVSRNRYVYPFVAGDKTTLKSGTIENVLSCTTTATTSSRSRFDKFGTLKFDLNANVLRLSYENGEQVLMAESVSTLRVIGPRDLTNAAWIKDGPTPPTVLKDQTGLDGVANSASSIEFTAAGQSVTQAFTLAAANRVLSAVVRRLAGADPLLMSLDGGATKNPVQTGAALSRVSLPFQSVANPVIGFYGTAGNKFTVEFVDMEDGLFATSIKNGSRNPEDIRFVGASDTTQAAGTFAIKGGPTRNSVGVFFMADNQRLLSRTANATQLAAAGENGNITQAYAGSGGVAGDYGAVRTFDATDSRHCLNGGAVAVSLDPVPVRSVSPRIGMLGTNAASQIAGSIKALYAGPVKIPDAQAQALASASVPA
jgi:hypothetical protein